MNQVPKCTGWYWWKATATSSPKEIKVTQHDIDQSKYAKWGGEWHPFPSFAETTELRSRIGEIEAHYSIQASKLKKYEDSFREFVELTVDVSRTVLTPRKKIKDFLEKMKNRPI